ncbi:hypothetical protein EDD16DRAFT_1530186 [Pisolithus croceorrhizus]|nr:hypothetical protein EDD16DRAFT_1530186 [Pisolithus croceorrhizus]
MVAALLQRSAVRRSLFPKCCKKFLSQAVLVSPSASTGQRRDIQPHNSVAHVTRQQEATEPDIFANKSFPDFTKVENYLTSIRSTGLQPTLEDIEGFRPSRHSRPGTKKYANEYRDLLGTLCRAFSKDQLRNLLELYKLDPWWSRAKRKKVEYAESIIEQGWGWPSLKELEERRVDRTEVISKSFPMSPRELFIILGKDGADLLQLSIQYNVHISLIPDPLALHVEGLRGALKQMTEHIDALRKDIEDEIFELPTRRSIPQALIQRISRLAGAYVENYGDGGKVRIFSRDDSMMRTAQRLAARASMEEGSDGLVSMLYYEPPGPKSSSLVPADMPHDYSVYPFLSPTPFPWTMHTGGAFRIRRTADWLGVNSQEDITKRGGLFNNEGRFTDFSGKETDLHKVVLNLPTGDDSSDCRLITASLGHLLLSPGEDSRPGSLLPPLRGRMPLRKVLRWLETVRPPTVFVPSFPPLALPAPHARRRTLHRLVYKTLHSGSAHMSDISPSLVVKVEAECLSESSGENSPAVSAVSCSDLSPPQYRIGREALVNLMIPDRPMDLQLSVFDYGLISEEQLPVLKDYFVKLRDYATSGTGDYNPPCPPATFDFDGRTYHLHDNWSLQQSVNLVDLNVSPTDESSAHPRVRVFHEKILDLEASQQSELCQLRLDQSSDWSWRSFLAACDKLTAPWSQARSKEI